MKKTVFLLLAHLFFIPLISQSWSPDLGNGMYKNPVIFADYSDPDVIRHGDDFFLVSSSFTCMPGIPVLHSKDLVNWEIINHVYQRLPLEKYNRPVHGEGSWAPSIRYHGGWFYVYFCTPRDVLFMARTEDPYGEWELHHVVKTAMWEDPCPLWDNDGNAYLVRSKLCGNELFIHRMSPDGTRILDNGRSVYRDELQPTIEGPKFLKRDGYYYILAPAGGVPTGWQAVLRSKNIYGPYEVKNVLHQGSTGINGPHQGGLVELESGESWFVHFQDRGFYGRIVHLQPVQWKDGWPLMGADINGDGIGEPVPGYHKPDAGKNSGVRMPQTSDEFEKGDLGLQWQWHANPMDEWYSLEASPGKIRLYPVQNITQNGNFWFIPNLLLQKFPMPAFTATACLDFKKGKPREHCGLVIMGDEWAYLSLTDDEEGPRLGMYEGSFDQCGDGTRLMEAAGIDEGACYLRVSVKGNGICQFSYSMDNKNYQLLGKEFRARKGRWIGAKVGLFCINPNMEEGEAWVDVDWFRITDSP